MEVKHVHTYQQYFTLDIFIFQVLTCKNRAWENLCSWKFYTDTGLQPQLCLPCCDYL